MKAVITAGGLGTRLLPVTKEIPKELLPLYGRGENGETVMKPVLQIIFEALYREGVREFCFVTGRGKRAIEDHFTPDWDFVEYLERAGKLSQARELRRFFEMLENSTIFWVKQPQPRGFGHAVFMARSFVGEEEFVVAAGDTAVYPEDFLGELFRGGSDAALLLKEVENPRSYGVAVVEGDRVVMVVEKPREPPSRLAILPFYLLPPEIMRVLEKAEPGVGGEVQLTDAIQKLIDEGSYVRAVILDERYEFADVGTPESYIKALEASFRRSREIL
ncbi:MAG: sugar phosphate nucleotidyltransferase [Acidilobaceae archaeon]|nr:sugar phosphate nucleotidyltransferase [Acidilobaceae archaeon]